MYKNSSINKILICSVGSIGRKYINTIKSNWPHIQIGALRSGHGKKFQELDLLDINFFSKEEAIKWKPDAAIICNPAPFHLEMHVYWVILFFPKMNLRHILLHYRLSCQPKTI